MLASPQKQICWASTSIRELNPKKLKYCNLSGITTNQTKTVATKNAAVFYFNFIHLVESLPSCSPIPKGNPSVQPIKIPFVEEIKH